MFYIRREGIDPIRQGFNFYPSWSVNVGCQMRFGPVRIEARFNKKKRKVHVGWWLVEKVPPMPEVPVYIPGYTEELKKIYEEQNKYRGKKFEDWSAEDRDKPKGEKQAVPSTSPRYRFTAWIK